jgi:hypothetical protein
LGEVQEELEAMAAGQAAMQEGAEA